ncbi:hypothetical protein B0H14DRAFT_3498562 [Mycena olivaceomarginata]|nr:hypothetical protein B0H14DRAFT_3498562 [Mycena olivaceomarginata]
MAPPKRKNLHADEDDLNDGSDSDDSADGYLPRQRVERVHFVPDESITIAATGQTRSTKSTVPTPASPAKKSRVTLNTDAHPPSPSPPPEDLCTDWQADFSEFDAEYGLGLEKPSRDLRALDNPHAQFAQEDREEFLNELVRQDGRGDYVYQQLCAAAGCAASSPAYRCSDCLHPCLYCERCVKFMHESLPLHHLEKWNGTSFNRCSLKDLGVRIQLGHPPGVPCSNPEKAWGERLCDHLQPTIDEVGLDYCNCGEREATTRTAPLALRRFAHMTLESKCSAYEFYNSLAHETNNTGLDPSRVRLIRRVSENDASMAASDAAETRRAGARPMQRPDQSNKAGFLYAIFLALDANFRLQRKDVSTEEHDPGLSEGWAFFGEVKKYMAHLDKHWAQPQERSTCVAHDAVDKPDRESLGTASLGIGTVDCARHNMKHPNGIGDLQRGERYLNMDYMFFMSLAGSALLWLYMQIFPEDIQFKKDEKNIVFLVPKFHLPAHIEECNIQFSFNLTRARRDTLDAYFQYSNWKKITKLGNILLQRVQRYIPLMLETQAAWVHLEVSFSESIIETWTAMAVAWEADSTKPNPFASTAKHEDLAEDMHDTEMLSMGLQLEQEQRALAVHMKQIGVHETTTQEQMQIERETKLRHKIDTWMGVQQLFIPEVVVLRNRETVERRCVAATQVLPGLKAQDMKLWFPSTIENSVQCDRMLREYEFKLRKGQAYRDGVHGVKAKLRSGARTDALQARIDTAASEYRAAHSALVKLGILLKDTEWQRHLPASEGRVHPSAVFGDDERRKGGSKKKKKQRLNPEAQTSQTVAQVEEAKKMSRIWVSEGTTGTDEDVAESEPLRIEWAKIRAKAMRYVEEIDLLEEEMRRVLQFLQWWADWWTSLVGLRAGKQEKLALREGHAAYARKQAGYMQDLRDCFEHQWRDVARELEVARELYEAMMPDPEEEGRAPGAGKDSGQTNISSGWLSE